MKALKPGCKPLGLGLRPLKLDLKPMKPGLRPLKPSCRPLRLGCKPLGFGLRPLKPGLRPLRPSWRPLRPGRGSGGRTDVRTYGRTDRTKSPYSKGHRPLRGRCPKSQTAQQSFQRAEREGQPGGDGEKLRDDNFGLNY